MAECLAHAVAKYKEITGKVSPSSGYSVGEWWRGATSTTASVKEYSVACWVDSKTTDNGHALCVGKYTASTKKYHCYEANYDLKGSTREKDWTGAEIKALYASKIWKGCAYN